MTSDRSFFQDRKHRATDEPPAPMNMREVKKSAGANSRHRPLRKRVNATATIPPLMDKASSVVPSVLAGSSALLIKTLRATEYVVSLSSYQDQETLT